VPLLKIDVQGTEQFCKAYPETETFFLLPPSIDIFKIRLLKQFANKAEEVNKRVKSALKEIQCGSQDPYIAYKILNDDLKRAQMVFIRLVECLYSEEIGFSKYVNKVPDPKIKFN
jgi:guanylate kinase